MERVKVATGLAASIVAGCALSGCGGGALAGMDAGADTTTTLSLSVVATAPALDQLVVTSGEIELEHLGLFGDANHDDRTEVARITFPLDGMPHSVVYDLAGPGLYSRLDTTIDHVSVIGTWRGIPLSIYTKGDERYVDLPCTPEQLSPTSSAAFSLTIDGTEWLDAAFIDGLSSGGAIEIDELTDPAAVDVIMARVVASFSVTAP